MIEFTKVEGTDYGNIRVFALSTCVWCNKTMQFLDNNNVAYSYVYVDKLSDEDVELCLQEQLKYAEEESYPLVAIGEKDCIIGYDKSELKKLIKG